MCTEKRKTESEKAHEKMTENIYFDVKWLVERWRPINYAAITIVSIIASAATTLIITHY